jgi:hypothetical protein
MKATKLAILAAVLLAAGAMGGGVGWLTYRAGGAEPAAPRAEEPTAVAPPDRLEPEDAPLRAEKERERQRKKAEDEAESLREKLQKMEHVWMAEVIAARKTLIEAEETLRKTEREQAEKRDRERADRDARAARIQQIQNTISEINARSKEPQKQRVDALRAELERETVVGRKMEQNGSDLLLKARFGQMEAEEQLRSLERRQANERAHMLARLEAVEDRLQHVQGEPPRRAATDRRSAELEGKLDRVLSELAEMRRELRRPPAPKPAEPAKP